jgi:hypothetical protein
MFSEAHITREALIPLNISTLKKSALTRPRLGEAPVRKRLSYPKCKPFFVLAESFDDPFYSLVPMYLIIKVCGRILAYQRVIINPS